jgi:DNA polymerase-1
MVDTWLVIDVNFLCHRASYAFAGLSHEGESTGVTFGFFSDLINLQQRFDAQHVAFCFDLGRAKRLATYPAYKLNRRTRERTPEEAAAQSAYRREIKRLWQEVLPSIGYENILISYGYEADDFVARACQAIITNFPGDEAVIIASDHDLLQCLCPGVKMWDPNKKFLHTIQSLASNYGVSPQDWVQVKAIAGCSGDEIPGAKGVGEKTATGYLRGELKDTSKAIATIQAFVQSTEYTRNLNLVKLPYHGTPEAQLVKSSPSSRGWQKVMREYGMDSLINRGPYLGRRGRKGGLHG